MSRRIAIVTGANRGIGRETALGLARAGLTVVMASRNLEQAEEVRAGIEQETGNQDIFVLPLDLASKASIRAFVDVFRERFKKVHILVNNAGISNTREKRTVDGLEPIVGTNFFGTLTLTELLLPLFEEGADCRIVTLVSNIYKNGRFDIARIDDYRWVKAYAVSKYLLLLYTLELAERLRTRGIAVNAVHPGIVNTSIMYVNRWYDAIIKVLISPFLVDPAEGARTSLHLALAEELKGASGGLYAKSAPVKISRRFDDPDLRREVTRLGLERMK
jgi:NAD(P)-dependent dehydrogenase (short-subunit alcohol dehydrogenase family)